MCSTGLLLNSVGKTAFVRIWKDPFRSEFWMMSYSSLRGGCLPWRCTQGRARLRPPACGRDAAHRGKQREGSKRTMIVTERESHPPRRGNNNFLIQGLSSPWDSPSHKVRFRSTTGTTETGLYFEIHWAITFCPQLWFYTSYEHGSPSTPPEKFAGLPAGPIPGARVRGWRLALAAAPLAARPGHAAGPRGRPAAAERAGEGAPHPSVARSCEHVLLRCTRRYHFVLLLLFFKTSFWPMLANVRICPTFSVPCGKKQAGRTDPSSPRPIRGCGQEAPRAPAVMSLPSHLWEGRSTWKSSARPSAGSWYQQLRGQWPHHRVSHHLRPPEMRSAAHGETRPNLGLSATVKLCPRRWTLDNNTPIKWRECKMPSHASPCSLIVPQSSHHSNPRLWGRNGACALAHRTSGARRA